MRYLQVYFFTGQQAASSSLDHRQAASTGTDPRSVRMDIVPRIVWYVRYVWNREGNFALLKALSDSSPTSSLKTFFDYSEVGAQDELDLPSSSIDPRGR